MSQLGQLETSATFCFKLNGHWHDDVIMGLLDREFR